MVPERTCIFSAYNSALVKLKKNVLLPAHENFRCWCCHCIGERFKAAYVIVQNESATFARNVQNNLFNEETLM